MWKIINYFFSTILLIVGLAGIPDNLKTWNNWIGNIMSYLDQDMIRWIFGIAGLFLIYMVTEHCMKLKIRLLSFFKITQPEKNKLNIKTHIATIVIFIVLLAVLYPFIDNSFKDKSSITLLPSTPNIRAIPQMSGSITEGSDEVTTVVRIGDNKDNKERRGFISFNLTKVDKDREIISARFTFHVPPLEPNRNIGGLNPIYFHTIILEIVDIGGGSSHGLDVEDFDRKGEFIKNIPFKDIREKSHDVKKVVMDTIDNGRVIVTFRLRFTESTDNNNMPDALTMRMIENKTKLVIRYD